MPTLSTFFDRTKDYHILVVGDVMLDRYIRGRVDRISPEAPVPVLQWESSENRLGGAANVALNLRRLGARVSIVGLTGEDQASEMLRDLLKEEGIDPSLLITDPATQTTLKTRVIGGHQHLLRIDEERDHRLTEAQLSVLLQSLRRLSAEHKPDGIILQDYNKGVLTPAAIREILELSAGFGIPVYVDPKDENFFAFTGVRIFKPNLRELRAKMPFPVEPDADSLFRATRHLKETLQCEIVAITLSEHGICLSEEGQARCYPTNPRNVVDVCGAGDAVISVLALADLMAMAPAEMAVLANTAGGVVCGEVGVCPVDVRKMKEELRETGAADFR